MERVGPLCVTWTTNMERASDMSELEFEARAATNCAQLKVVPRMKTAHSARMLGRGAAMTALAWHALPGRRRTTICGNIYKKANDTRD